jgi:hypothetical protein
VRYTVTCEAVAVGYVELPPLEAWEDGAADGTFEALPAFGPLRLRLESALRAAFLMHDRVEAARRDGRLPAQPLTASLRRGEARALIRDITPEEQEVMGADALEAVMDGARIAFHLRDADGRMLPANAEVHVMLTTLPEAPEPDRPAWVTVFVPPTDRDAPPSRPDA